VAVISDDEIIASIHKFKVFREEGNFFIDVYEALIGKPAHKFIAVPNLLMQEADKKYFGFGDTKAEALKDCLKKIKGVPIHVIVSTENLLENDVNLDNPPEPVKESIRKLRSDSEKHTSNIHPTLGIIHGVALVDSPRSNDSLHSIILAKEEGEKSKLLKNAKITAKCKGFKKRKTKTDTFGRYEFTDLEDGRWELKLKAKGYDKITAIIDISSGGKYEQNF